MDFNACALLFDIDGTLVDSTYHHAIAWQRAFDSLDLPIPLWRIHRSVGMGGDKLVAEVAGETVEDKQGDELRDRWREEYLKIKDEVVPLPGAAELIGSLSKQGYQVALASSGDPEFSREAMETLGVTDDVAVLTTSEDVDDSKPDPDLLQETLKRLEGVTHAVMVGDTPYDVESARKAGMQCVTLRSGGYGEAELVDAGAALVVDVPEDLVHLDWEKYLSELSRDEEGRS
jgi:HAD superfamily hydrolase (TIGR01549 family)